MLISTDSRFRYLAGKLLLLVIVQIQLQSSCGVTQLLPIQVPNSSTYNQNQQFLDPNNYDTDGAGDYYSGGGSQSSSAAGPPRGGKMYLKSGLSASAPEGSHGNSFGIGNSGNSLLNTLSNYGSKFWPSGGEDSSASGSSYGSGVDSQHSDAALAEDGSTSYGALPGVAAGILGSGSSYSTSDTNYGHEINHGGSYRYGHGQGAASHHYPTKTYQYHVYPGTKGWTSAGHGHGHGHTSLHSLHNIGAGWNGWSSQGTGWGSDLGFGHDIFENVGAWLGIKAIKGGTIVSILKSLLIIIPAGAIIILLILLLPIPVIIIPHPKCATARQIGDDGLPTIGKSRLWNETGRIAKLVLNSDSCVERISCEIGKMARKYQQNNYLIETIMRFLPASNYTERIARSINADTAGEITDGVDNISKIHSDDNHSGSFYMENKNTCKKFSCDPVGRLKREFNRIWTKTVSSINPTTITTSKSNLSSKANSSRSKTAM